MKLKSLLFLVTLALLLPSLSYATPAVNTEDHQAGIVTMDEMVADKVLTAQELKTLKKEEKKQVRMERRMERVEKFMNSKLGQKLLGGLDDPVDKFFWFWIIGWGAGIVLTIIASAALTSGSFGVLWLLAYLAWLAGSVSLIVWLVKKFS
jgi:hypothetical protein